MSELVAIETYSTFAAASTRAKQLARQFQQETGIDCYGTSWLVLVSPERAEERLENIAIQYFLEFEPANFAESQWEYYQDLERRADDILAAISWEETCDWCGGKPVTYEDESYTLCEMCEEQLCG